MSNPTREDFETGRRQRGLVEFQVGLPQPVVSLLEGNDQRIRTFAECCMGWLQAYDDLQEVDPGMSMMWPEIFDLDRRFEFRESL